MAKIVELESSQAELQAAQATIVKLQSCEAQLKSARATISHLQSCEAQLKTAQAKLDEIDAREQLHAFHEVPMPQEKKEAAKQKQKATNGGRLTAAPASPEGRV